MVGSWFASSAKITGSLSTILARVLGGGFEAAIHGRGTALGLVDGVIEGGHAGMASLRCGLEAIAGLANRHAHGYNPDESKSKFVARGEYEHFPIAGCCN